LTEFGWSFDVIVVIALTKFVASWHAEYSNDGDRLEAI
jgi:hypothetical protein